MPPHKKVPERVANTRLNGLVELLTGHFRRRRLPYAIAASAAIFIQSSFSISGLPAFPGMDKIIHTLVYTVLGLTYLNVTTAGFSRCTRVGMLTGWAATVLFGISDEFHQSFVPGRHSDEMDVLADAIGGALAVGGGFLLCTLIKKGRLSVRENRPD